MKYEREVGKWVGGWLGRHLDFWVFVESLVLLHVVTKHFFRKRFDGYNDNAVFRCFFALLALLGEGGNCSEHCLIEKMFGGQTFFSERPKHIFQAAKDH